MSRWISDPGIAEALGVHRQASLKETEGWIERALEDQAYAPFAILAAGQHVGNVILDQIDRHLAIARLSIYIGEAEARGSGVGETSVELALRHAFAELELYKVWLIVHASNGAAIATYSRCGFSVEGLLRGEFIVAGQRVDALRMAIDSDRFGSR